MKRIRIIHRLRITMALLGFLAVISAGVGLWWVNYTGLPESWRDGIEDALAKHGLHADVASLSYIPLRGIEADEVIIYSDAAHTRVIATLNELLLDIDRSHLARGEMKIERIELMGARVSIAVDPEDPQSKALEIDNVSGRILMPSGRRMEIQDARGSIGGVQVQLDGALLMYRPRHVSDPEDIAATLAQRKRILTAIIETMDNWGPQSENAPLIRVNAQGDLEEPGSLRATISVQGKHMKSGDFEIQHLDIQAELRGQSLVLHHGEIRSSNGQVTGQMEYDMGKKAGRFDASASLDPDLKALILNLNLPLPEELPGFGSAATLEGHGSFSKVEDEWTYQLIGYCSLDQPRFRQYSADHVAASFSWDGSRLFLEDLLIERAGESLTGRLFITPEIIRYEAKTGLPLSFWQETIPFKTLSKVLHDFSATDETEISVDFHGSVDPRDKTSWVFIGQAEASHISYKGIPANHARVKLDLNHKYLDFSEGEAEFDYRAYPLRKRFDGPKSGRVKVDRIRYNREASTLVVEEVRGRAYPAPILRTFSPSIADHVEEYGFHRPPDLVANGLVGIKDGTPKMKLRIDFKTAGRASYTFAGKNLLLAEPEGHVMVLPRTVQVNDLSFGLCDGLVRGELVVHTVDSDALEGELDWTNLDLPKLAATYGSKDRPAGKITGRIEFNMLGGDVSGLNGKGHLALNDGELFDVPVFGPLSPVISAVLGKRAAGFQEAKDAFCTFQIRKGIFATQDFLTTTPVLVFTGDALVDLNDQMFEMTVRMNARGLLGVITLPLRPFYGLFQFRGTGLFRKPEWKNVMFTSPPKDQNDALMTPPKARAVAPATRR